MYIRVGSDLQPAPMEEITGIPLSWQYFKRATLETILSIASTTYVGFCPLLSPSSVQGPSCASATEEEKSAFMQSKWTHGVTCCKRLRMVCTLGVPTSASVATACRFRDERVT